MTHVQPAAGGMTVYAALDVILCSNTLTPRLRSCTIDDRPRHWAKGRDTGYSSYHKAVIGQWCWADLWPMPGTDTDPSAPPHPKSTERIDTKTGAELQEPNRQ